MRKREREKERETWYGRGSTTTKRRVVEERGSNGEVVRGSLVNARENWLLNLAAGMSSAPPGGWSPLATLRSFPSAPPKGGGWNEKLLRFGGREGEVGGHCRLRGGLWVPTKIREATSWNGLP